jgi:hypothetical protein
VSGGGCEAALTFDCQQKIYIVQHRTATTIVTAAITTLPKAAAGSLSNINKGGCEGVCDACEKSEQQYEQQQQQQRQQQQQWPTRALTTSTTLVVAVTVRYAVTPHHTLCVNGRINWLFVKGRLA